MAPVLIFGYGNPSRGDDALGPALIARLEDLQATRGAGQPPWDLLTDFQPQPEHALDLVGRDRVILVDADVSLAVPYRLEPILADRAASYTTHAMSPGALLWVYGQIGAGAPPPAWLLRIRGYHFALGAPLSAGAVENLAGAEGGLRGFLGVG
jgi:hydrogenase maturation protease